MLSNDLIRQAQSKAYDLRSMSAARVQRDRFIKVFNELYPILVQLNLDCNYNQRMVSLPSSDDENYLSYTQDLSKDILSHVLDIYPLEPEPKY